MQITVDEIKDLRGREKVRVKEIAEIAECSEKTIYLYLQFIDPETRRAYYGRQSKDYRDTHLEEVREYGRERIRRLRERNPEPFRASIRRWKKKQQAETLASADTRYRRWDIVELAYLEKQAPKLTATQIALELGRTLFGVGRTAARYKISLKKPLP